MSLQDVPVESTELLARTIHTERHIRKADSTLRAELFLPFKHVDLSVIRHRELSEMDLWAVCVEVGRLRNQPLLGRGDVLVSDAIALNLGVEPDEGEGIPRNHANIVGWPHEKPAQMMKAVELAREAKLSRAPSAA